MQSKLHPCPGTSYAPFVLGLCLFLLPLGRVISVLKKLFNLNLYKRMLSNVRKSGYIQETVIFLIFLYLHRTACSSFQQHIFCTNYCKIFYTEPYLLQLTVSNTKWSIAQVSYADLRYMGQNLVLLMLTGTWSNSTDFGAVAQGLEITSGLTNLILLRMYLWSNA